MRSCSIQKLLRSIQHLKGAAPQSDLLSERDLRMQWIGWLRGYDGPGYYNRANWDRDARFVYQHLNNGPMIVWLNEVAGENPELIRLTISKMLRGGPRKQTIAKIARAELPWERAAMLLFD